MTPQDKIVKFLQTKNKTIYKNTKLRYIYDKDLEYIEEVLDSSIANDIWGQIQFNICFEDAKGLTSLICPWCIEKQINDEEDCFICTYGQVHGICFRSKDPNKYISHYDHIYKVLDSKNIKDYKILSNQWYRNLIKKIESNQ